MRKSIHYIDRYMANGGGMPLFVDEMAIDEMIIAVESDRIDTRLKKIKLDKQYVNLTDLLSVMNFENPEYVILHTLKHISPKIIEKLKSQNRGVIFIVHDYYAICEKEVLINNRKQICSGPYSKNCIYCYYDKYRYIIPLSRQIRDFLKPLISLFLKKTSWYESRLEYHKSILNKLNLIVFPSVKAKNVMMRFLDKSCRTEVISHFQRPLVCKREKSNLCEFGFIGHDSYHKGFDVLKDAVARTKYEELSVHLFGDFRRHIKSKHFIYEGSFENRNLSSPMMKFDALLFPSTWPETSGRVMTEAAACGKYIIASNITPAEEILKGYEGLIVFENNDASSLISAMEKLYSSWKSREFPLKPYPFKSISKYREEVFKKAEEKNG
ncbi:MAG: glycosyltransferase [bacterium]|nr:glycosyltransferase [bacterium]